MFLLLVYITMTSYTQHSKATTDLPDHWVYHTGLRLICVELTVGLRHTHRTRPGMLVALSIAQ